MIADDRPRRNQTGHSAQRFARVGDGWGRQSNSGVPNAKRHQLGGITEPGGKRGQFCEHRFPLGSPTKMTSGVSTGAVTVPVHAHQVASRSYGPAATAHACLLRIRGVVLPNAAGAAAPMPWARSNPLYSLLAAVGAYAERVQLRECDVGGANWFATALVVLVCPHQS